MKNEVIARKIYTELLNKGADIGDASVSIIEAILDKNIPHERVVIKKNAEYIICAAVYFDNKQVYEHQPNNIKTGYVVCGHRHHNCFMTMDIFDPQRKHEERKFNPVQGFITNTNKFVDRYEAFEIALKANQVLINTERKIKKLFSEDIY